MSYSKLIHEYLDEGLPGVQEETLFSELARDASLRIEFNKQVQLHLLAQNDMNSITPPIDITNNVFTTLGFAIPTAEPIAAIGGFFSKFSKYGVMAVLLFVAAILPVSIYYGYDNYYADNSTVLNLSTISNSIERNEQNTSDVVLSHSAGIPITNSESLDDENSLANSGTNLSNRNYDRTNTDRTNTASGSSNASNNSFAANNLNLSERTHQSNLVFASSEDRGNSDLANSNMIEANTSILPEDLASTYRIRPINQSAQNYSNINFPASKFMLPHENSNLFYQNLTIDNTKFAVAIKGISIEGAYPNKQAGSFTLQDNVNITAIYKLDAYNAVGIEFGKEQFSQEFTRIIAGKEHLQHQTPAIYWAGLTYRLIVPDWAIMNRIIPYTQFSAGINNIGGSLFKLQPGLEWRIGSNFSLIIAGDFSTILYNYDNVIYNSEKFGVVYGINVNL